MSRRQCNASLVEFAGTLICAGLLVYAVWACYTLCSSAGGLSRAAFWTEGEVRMDSPSYWDSRFTLGASVITLRMQSPVFHTLQQHTAWHCPPLQAQQREFRARCSSLRLQTGPLTADPRISDVSDIAPPCLQSPNAGGETGRWCRLESALYLCTERASSPLGLMTMSMGWSEELGMAYVPYSTWPTAEALPCKHPCNL